MPIITLLLPFISSLVTQFESLVSPENKDKVKPIFDQHLSDFEVRVAESDAKIAASQASVLNNEASLSWLGANWRPCLMFLFMGLIFLVYGVGTIISFFKVYRPIELPNELWNLILISIPGYIGLRTHEKQGLPGSKLITDVINKIIKKE